MFTYRLYNLIAVALVQVQVNIKYSSVWESSTFLMCLTEYCLKVPFILFYFIYIYIYIHTHIPQGILHRCCAEKPNESPLLWLRFVNSQTLPSASPWVEWRNLARQGNRICVRNLSWGMQRGLLQFLFPQRTLAWLQTTLTARPRDLLSNGKEEWKQGSVPRG